MVNPNDVYSEYLKHGGLSGICDEITEFLSKNWEKHEIIQELFKKAVEIYKKAFPRGKPPKSPSEVIRRIGIFAAHLGRLRKIKSPRVPEFEKLYYEYRDIAHRMMYYRNAWRDLSKYIYYYYFIKDILKAAKITVNEYKKASLLFDAIYSFYNRTKWILDYIRNRHPNAYDVWKFFADRFNLGTLWFEFKYALTLDTKDEYWIYRMLEVHIQTWTHAELLFIDITDRRLSEVTELIFELTNNSWLLNFDELAGMPYEYESKQLLRFLQGVMPKEVDFNFSLYDHNYGFERVKAYGKIPYDWQKLKAREIIDWILRTGDIEYYEVRGTQGRLKRGISYILTSSKVGEIEIKKVEKIFYEGVEKDIRDFLRKYSVKKKKGSK